MALKILHTADLHLGRLPRSVDLGGSNPPFDVFPTFSDICHLALQEKVDILIIAGDLFDCANPETRLVGQVAAELRRLGSAGITVVISPGTHDTLSFSYSIFHSDPFPQAIIFKESVVTEPV
ncbi:DNA repair protein SbcD/Mre11, partial [Candidatus Hakubella thermalkaliphila]